MSRSAGQPRPEAALVNIPNPTQIWVELYRAPDARTGGPQRSGILSQLALSLVSDGSRNGVFKGAAAGVGGPFV